MRLPAACAIAAVVAALSGHAATVEGSIVLTDSQDPGVVKKKDYSGVVVWLEGADGKPIPATPRTVTMRQRNKRFDPHTLAIPVGTVVDFPNFDPIFHNAFSNFSGQPFDVGLYAPGTTRKIEFRRAGIVRVFCNIHPTMSAVIAVVPTPYLAVTTRGGSFSIDGVEPGAYRLKLFHERSTAAELQAREQTVTVPRSGLELPAVRLSETGYLPVPHKNKYGKPYPPPADGPATYPSRRNE